MAFSDFGNGTGYIYVTETNGTDIVINVENDQSGREAVLLHAYIAGPYTGSTGTYDSTYGYRYFLDATAGAREGVVGGATEITGLVIGRGLEHPIYEATATIASGVITLDRVGSIMKINVETEGLVAADDLDTITVNDASSGDIIIVNAVSSLRNTTLLSGTGNITLTNATSFTTGDTEKSIILQYRTGGGVVNGWREVTRSAILPTVSVIRSQAIPQPVSGVESVSMPTSGTVDIEPGVDKGVYIITGSPVLVGNIVYRPDPSGTYLDGEKMVIDYRATPTLGANTITIFGETLSDPQTASRLLITSYYRAADTTWYTTITPNIDGVDYATTTQLSTKEDDLGNPGSDGQILSSTASGTRSWIPNANNPVYSSEISDSATTAVTTAETLKSYTLPGGTMSVDYDEVDIEAVFRMAATATDKTPSLTFGGTTVAAAPTAVYNNVEMVLKATISRINNTSQFAVGTTYIDGSAPVITLTNPAETLSGDIVIAAVGQNGIANANDIVCKKLTVRKAAKR